MTDKKVKYISDNVWLYLLKEALDRGVKVAMNHGFIYKGYKLGSFLVRAKRRRNNQDIVKKIEEIGFLYKYHNKTSPNDYLEKYIHQLENDENPVKIAYATRFNTYVLPKKNLLDKELKKKLVKVWKEKFGDTRKWKKRDGYRKKVAIWKKFRYDKNLNPEGLWIPVQSKYPELYFWTYARRKKPHLMEKIVKYFTNEELIELQRENFPIGSKNIDKPKYRRITKEEKLKRQLQKQ